MYDVNWQFHLPMIYIHHEYNIIRRIPGKLVVLLQILAEIFNLHWLKYLVEWDGLCMPCDDGVDSWWINIFYIWPSYSDIIRLIQPTYRANHPLMTTNLASCHHWLEVNNLKFRPIRWKTRGNHYWSMLLV